MTRESEPNKLPLLPPLSALCALLASLVCLAWFGPAHPVQAGQLGQVAQPAVATSSLASGSSVALVAASSTTQVFYGFCVRETAAGTAVINFRNGAVIGAPVIFTLSLVANESRSEWFAAGLPGAAGIYVERVSGTTDVIAYTGAY